MHFVVNNSIKFSLLNNYTKIEYLPEARSAFEPCSNKLLFGLFNLWCTKYSSYSRSAQLKLVRGSRLTCLINKLSLNMLWSLLSIQTNLNNSLLGSFRPKRNFPQEHMCIKYQQFKLHMKHTYWTSKVSSIIPLSSTPFVPLFWSFLKFMLFIEKTQYHAFLFFWVFKPI